MCSIVESNLLKLTGEDKPSCDISSAFEIARRITGSRDSELYLTAGKVRDAILRCERHDDDYDFIGRINLDRVVDRVNGTLLGRWDSLGVAKVRVGKAEFDFIFPNLKLRPYRSERKLNPESFFAWD